MIFKWDFLTFLFMFVQFLSARDLDIDPEDVKATAKPPVVVIGDPTYIGEYPFSVIFYENKPRVIRMGSFLSPICSGSVISSRWILTTAVPLGHYPVNKYFALAGIQEITDNPDAVTNFTDNIYRIEMMVVHPLWHEYYFNNLGMVKTTEPFKFGKELGTIRMPSKYDIEIPSDYNDTICTLNIWGPVRIQHLMGSYQVVLLSKQTIYLNIQRDPLKFCPGVVHTDKTLCLKQFDPANPYDICAVNLGGIVLCDCKAVGVFSGVKGKLDCVGIPPKEFTAVNITQYLKWITMVSEAAETKNYYVHISSAFCICLSFNLTMIYFFMVVQILFLE